MRKAPARYRFHDANGGLHFAEAVGFEPTVRCRTMVFKTISFGRSDTLPMVRNEPRPAQREAEPQQFLINRLSSANRFPQDWSQCFPMLVS